MVTRSRLKRNGCHSSTRKNRLKREEKLTSVPNIDSPKEVYQKIKIKEGIYTIQSEETANKIENDTENLRAKILPEIAGDFERETKLTNLTERLPERISEPPSADISGKVRGVAGAVVSTGGNVVKAIERKAKERFKEKDVEENGNKK